MPVHGVLDFTGKSTLVGINDVFQCNFCSILLIFYAFVVLLSVLNNIILGAAELLGQYLVTVLLDKEIVDVRDEAESPEDKETKQAKPKLGLGSSYSFLSFSSKPLSILILIIIILFRFHPKGIFRYRLH